MTVYLDVVFALNAAINYLLLRGAGQLAGAPLRRQRLGLAAALGGVYAAAGFVPGWAFLRSLWMEGLMLGAMAALAFGVRRHTPRLALLTAAFAAALAGAAMMCAQLFQIGPRAISGALLYPLRARSLLLLAACGFGLCQLVFSCCAAQNVRLVPVTIRLGGRAVCLTALVDTGNTLKDPLSNEPVLVADWRLAARLVPEAALCREDVAHPAEALPGLAVRCPECRFRLLPYRTVGTESGLLLALRCTISEYGEKGVVRLVAFSPNPVSQHGEFEALTGGKL